MTPSRSEPSWQRDIGTRNNVVLVDPLAVIYNEGQWKLYKISPLYNLQSDPVKLKQYASKIRQAIVSTVAVNSSLKYVVAVDSEPHLKYSDNDPHGLIITVTNSTPDVIRQAKVVYTAVLLCWGVKADLKNATHLPYLLERGEQSVGTAVKSTLQTIFDCNIKQFYFTQHQLLQLGFNFLEYDMSREQEQFSMVYKNPQAELNDKQTFFFEIGDVRIMWNGAKEEAASPTEYVNYMYQIIQAQILHMSTIDISVLELQDIQLPKGGLKSNGIVKMKNAEMVNCVFTFLNQICSLNSYKE